VPETAERTNGGSPAKGPGHPPDCSCTRCQGFPLNHELSLTHGAYSSPARLAPEAERYASWIRETAPLRGDANEPLVALASLSLRRAELAALALDELDTSTETRPLAQYVGAGEFTLQLQRLREDMRGWIGLAARLLDKLGCSPTSRAALGLDVVKAQAISSSRHDVDLDRLPLPRRALFLELLREAQGVEDAS
jgi:hypothetical protein